MKPSKKLSDLPPMNDEELGKFWDKNEPEDFEGWKEGSLKFMRPPKKLVQLRLDPRDIRIIDRESKHSGIDRAQLVRSWVKEKIRHIAKQKGLQYSFNFSNFQRSALSYTFSSLSPIFLPS